MDSFFKDGKEYFKLTHEELNCCILMIDGKAQPSDFGWDFTWAAHLLAFCSMTVLEPMLDREPPEFRAKTEAMIKKADELIRTFSEAGKLTGEQPDG
jgi:hypothetical protein